jgi:hypothetical protein
MKAKIGTVEVEGTPEEIGRLIRDLGTLPGATSDKKMEDAGDRKFVSEEIAFKMIKRRPLSDAQRALFAKLASEHPGWTSALDLQKATKFNANQLAGLLGAVGKRIGSTEGYINNSTLVDYKWDYEQDCYLYRLPEGVLAAVRRAGL